MTRQRIGDLPDPGSCGPRYSQRPFPAYRYVPGVHPHPVRDPRGHSYAAVLRMNRHGPWRPEDWRRLEEWLYGVDLFNAFYFWEAHEAWEGLWAACERHGDPALFLQGLIQIAAALLKVHMGVLVGARSLAREGVHKLDRVRARHTLLLGLSLTAVADAFRQYFAPLEGNALPLLGPDVPRLQLLA